MSAHTPFTKFIQMKDCWTLTRSYDDIDLLTPVYTKSNHSSHNTNWFFVWAKNQSQLELKVKYCPHYLKQQCWTVITWFNLSFHHTTAVPGIIKHSLTGIGHKLSLSAENSRTEAITSPSYHIVVSDGSTVTAMQRMMQAHTVPSMPVKRHMESFKLFDIGIKVQIVRTPILWKTFMSFLTFILFSMWHQRLLCLTIIKKTSLWALITRRVHHITIIRLILCNCFSILNVISWSCVLVKSSQSCFLPLASYFLIFIIHKLIVLTPFITPILENVMHKTNGSVQL